jgi:hypothetical protein
VHPTRSSTGFNPSLPLICGLLVYAQVLAMGGRVLRDPDTYWHIAVGRWIIAHHEVPHHDVFSFTMQGAPWAAPEWLAEILLASLYDHFGWGGLMAITALCAAAAVTLLMRALLRDLAPIHALIATVSGWILALNHIEARPHIFALPILVGWVAVVVRARSEDRAPAMWLLPLMTLWANLHGSYMLGLGLAALLAGEAVLTAADWSARLRAVRGWALFGGLSLGAAMITPFGPRGLMLPFISNQLGFMLAMVHEWQSPNFQAFQPLELWIMALLGAALGLGWQLPPSRLAMVLLLLHLALRHARYAEPLGLVAPLLMAPPLAPQLEARFGGRLTLLDRRLGGTARLVGAAGIALAGLVLAGMTTVLARTGVAVPATTVTPAAALAAVEAHHIQGNVFNDYDFGGYLIFRGVKPFIDGRYLPYGDAYAKRYAGAMAALGDQLPSLLGEYGITWTLIAPTQPAVAVLDHLPGWRRLYADDIAVVHVREDDAAR